jgi:hypothetical protein
VTAAVNDGTADLRRSTKLRLRLFSPLDWASWASLISVAALVALASGLLSIPYLLKIHKLQAEQERQLARARAEQEEQDRAQEGRLQLILDRGAGVKAPGPARPGSLIFTGVDTHAICCVVRTRRSRYCFLTSNTSFVNLLNPVGERVYRTSKFGGPAEAPLGVVEAVNPVDFKGENVAGGALVYTDPALVTAKMPPEYAIHAWAPPRAGQSVRLLIGEQAFSGTVAGQDEGANPISFLKGNAQFKGLIKIALSNPADLDYPPMLSGAPVITEGSHELIGMTYGLTKRHVVAIPIAPLFESLGVEELLTD